MIFNINLKGAVAFSINGFQEPITGVECGFMEDGGLHAICFSPCTVCSIVISPKIL